MSAGLAIASAKPSFVSLCFSRAVIANAIEIGFLVISLAPRSITNCEPHYANAAMLTPSLGSHSVLWISSLRGPGRWAGTRTEGACHYLARLFVRSGVLSAGALRGRTRLMMGRYAAVTEQMLRAVAEAVSGTEPVPQIVQHAATAGGVRR